jgi:hypothetical protein
MGEVLISDPLLQLYLLYLAALLIAHIWAIPSRPVGQKTESRPPWSDRFDWRAEYSVRSSPVTQRTQKEGADPQADAFWRRSLN